MSASLSPPVTGWRTLGLLNRYHWFVFVVAALGWLADCMDQQLFNLLRVRAVAELLGKPTSDPTVKVWARRTRPRSSSSAGPRAASSSASSATAGAGSRRCS